MRAADYFQCTSPATTLRRSTTQERAILHTSFTRIMRFVGINSMHATNGVLVEHKPLVRVVELVVQIVPVELQTWCALTPYWPTSIIVAGNLDPRRRASTAAVRRTVTHKPDNSTSMPYPVGLRTKSGLCTIEIKSPCEARRTLYIVVYLISRHSYGSMTFLRSIVSSLPVERAKNANFVSTRGFRTSTMAPQSMPATKAGLRKK